MDNLIITPNYVTEFNCVGPACEDSCCKNWTVYFDKKSYKNTISNPAFADLAKIAFVEIKESKDNWASIKLDDQGACPFLTQEELCKIHQVGGETALSYTCKTYPKKDTLVGKDKYQSLSLSCPEAARLVLFDPNAFQFQSHNGGNKKPTKPSPVWLEKSYQYSLDLLINANLDWDLALLSIGLLMKTSESASQYLIPIEELDKRHEQLKRFALSGLMAQQFEKLPFEPNHQANLFVTMHAELCSINPRSDQPRFSELNAAIDLVCNEDNHYSLENINQGWHQVALPALEQNPDIFERYILYYLFHNHFPGSETQTPSQAFTLLVIDCFIIRCYLSAMALKNDGLSQRDIILCFQAYLVVRQHRQTYTERLLAILEECGLNSISTVMTLLKTS
jgi:lysine-N-methylase